MQGSFKNRKAVGKAVGSRGERGLKYLAYGNGVWCMLYGASISESLDR